MLASLWERRSSDLSCLRVRFHCSVQVESKSFLGHPSAGELWQLEQQSTFNGNPAGGRRSSMLPPTTPL